MLASKLKYFDKFGETVNFTVGNDETSYRTLSGSLISILINCLMLVYGIRQGIVLLSYGDTNTSTTVNKRAIDLTLVQTAEEIDFAFGFGVFLHSEGPGQPPRPQSAQQYSEYISLDLIESSDEANKDTGGIKFSKEDIKHSLCSDQRIRSYVEQDEVNEFLTFEVLQSFQFRCPDDPSKVIFKGELGTQEHYWPSLTVKKCKNNSYCKSEQEINNFVSQAVITAFVMTQSYNSENLEKPITKFLRFYTYQLKISNDGSYEQTIIQITQESLESDDKLYSLGIFTNDYHFQTSPAQTDLVLRQLPPDDDKLLQIDFMLSLDTKSHMRAIYGPLDYLGQVGGLAAILTDIGSMLLFLLHLITGSQLSSYLHQQIFFKDNSQKLVNSTTKEKVTLFMNRRAFREESAFVCLRNKQQRARYLDAEKKLSQELDVARFIRQQKYLKVVIDFLFTKQERCLLSKNNRLSVSSKKAVSSSEQMREHDLSKMKIKTYKQLWLLNQAFRESERNADQQDPNDGRKFIPLKTHQSLQRKNRDTGQHSSKRRWQVNKREQGQDLSDSDYVYREETRNT